MSLVLSQPAKPVASNANKPISMPDLIADAVESAHVAGLRYVHDTGPGITRRRAGEDFTYFGPEGKEIHDPEVLARIKSLAIPPAYTDVWICPIANGHLQATGRDAKGRKQYRYHPRWREVRDSTKYGRTIGFAEALPTIRKKVEHGLALHGMPREKLLAALIRLLEATRIRIGNEEYARANHSYGLTTLRSHHVDVTGATIHFHFRAKSGKTSRIDLKDRRLARIIQRCQEIPGQELFEYLDEEGQPHGVTSTDVNTYLREISGEDFTAKDFRTWSGTVLAAVALAECGLFTSQAQAKKNIVRAVEQVAEHLGNTPAVCRKCYIHPDVIEAYLEGSLVEALGLSSSDAWDSSTALQPEEVAVVSFLKKRARKDW